MFNNAIYEIAFLMCHKIKLCIYQDLRYKLSKSSCCSNTNLRISLKCKKNTKSQIFGEELYIKDLLFQNEIYHIRMEKIKYQK